MPRAVKSAYGEQQQGDTEGAEEGGAARDVHTSRSMVTIVNQTTARRGEGTPLKKST